LLDFVCLALGVGEVLGTIRLEMKGAGGGALKGGRSRVGFDGVGEVADR